MKHPYIAIEGPIGSGKSTLAQLLAQHFDSNLLLEQAADNPFLPLFYRDMSRHALATQMFFLFQRINQLSRLRQPDLFARRTVTDYILEKDRLFARLTLDDNEFALYTQLYDHLSPQAPKPDLVIYLQASVDVLLARIHRRARAMERGISRDYLLRLSESYMQFFYNYHDAPLLIVNNDRLNFAEERTHFDILLQRIERMKSAREYFNLAS